MGFDPRLQVPLCLQMQGIRVLKRLHHIPSTLGSTALSKVCEFTRRKRKRIGVYLIYVGSWLVVPANALLCLSQHHWVDEESLQRAILCFHKTLQGLRMGREVVQLVKENL